MNSITLFFWILASITVPTIVAATATNSGDDDDDDDANVPSGRKNIILFMTDDQDVTANSIHPNIMPKLNKLFREGGMEFPHYYVPTGLCCPSRSTILRGQYCHNTEIFDNGNLNNATYRSGGWQKFLENGLEDETIATLLQSAGYETALIGKYMNGYDVYHKQKAALHKPPGWDHWMGLLKCMKYYGPIFSQNGKRILKLNDTVYQTDYIRDWVLDFLNHNRNTNKPFFLMVTPFAPHTPATPAKRHQHLFPDAKFPRYESFDPPQEVQEQFPAWIGRMPKLTEQQIDDMDNFYRKRLRSLQAVDEALESIAQTLDDLNLTDSTYFIYTADNGQHFGDHRIPAGKRQAYETDVLVPFFVRGPGIPKGTFSPQVLQSVDLGPTFLDIATSSSSFTKQQYNTYEVGYEGPVAIDGTKLTSTYPMDGKSILPLLTATNNNTNNDNNNTPSNSSNHNDFRWAALLEMYGGSSTIGLRYNGTKGFYRNHMFPNTYQAVRVIDGPSPMVSGANLLYVEWCTGEQELYNMTVDPHQVRNLLAPTAAEPSPDTLSGGDDDDENPLLLPLVHRLSRLLAKLGNCTGSDCYEIEQEWLESERNVPSLESGAAAELQTARSLQSLQSSIRNRIPCHDPPKTNNGDVIDPNRHRRPFAYNKYVPEPFQDGFPFSDADQVGEDLLRAWETYGEYFY